MTETASSLLNSQIRMRAIQCCDGFVHYLGCSRKQQILVVGQNDSGRCTVIRQLLREEYHKKFHFEAWLLENLNADTFLLSGSRRVWQNTVAIILLVDITYNEHGRLRDFQHEVYRILERKEDLNGMPIAMLFNKIDADTAIDPRQVAEIINFEAMKTVHEKIKVFPVSAMKNEGLDDAMKWILDRV